MVWRAHEGIAVISIISVTYNNLEGLKKTVQSYLEQAIQEIELLIIDGGSTDGTVEFLSSLSHPSITTISEKDRGISDAFNKGIQRAKFKWICFLNAGDTFRTSTSLRSAMDELASAKHETPIVTFQAQTNPTNNIFPSHVDLSSPEKRSMISHQASFIRSSTFTEFGLFDLNYRLRMDYEFFLRVFVNRTPEFRALPIISYDVYGRSSRLINRPRFEAEGAVAEFLILRKSPAHLLKLLWRISKDVGKKCLSYSYYKLRYGIDLF